MVLPINLQCDIIKLCNLNFLLGDPILDKFIIYHELYPKNNILTVCVYHSLTNTLPLLLKSMTPEQVFKDHNNFNKLIEIVVKKGNISIMNMIIHHCHEYIFSLDSKLTSICYKLSEYMSYLRKFDQLKHKNNILEFYNIFIKYIFEKCF
jgi:hypothetical protein